MTQLDKDAWRHIDKRFDGLAAEQRARVYGVDYARFRLDTGGLLYVTRFGWPLLQQITPDRWFIEERYRTAGVLLPGATGTVYRVPVTHSSGRVIDLVLKFSRVAQDLPVFPGETFAVGIPSTAKTQAYFSDPFEEFGLLMALRNSAFGPPELKIRTKRPLAIYSPSTRYELWRLGRNPAVFAAHQYRLTQHQQTEAGAQSVELDIHRDYITIFQWVKGMDSLALYRAGVLSKAEMEALTYRVSQELASKGFWVLDNKPAHFVLWQRGSNFMMRDGKLVYALIDFELLKPTPAYEDYVGQPGPGRII